MKKFSLYVSVLGTCALLAGCSTWQQETLSEQNWGRSYQTAKYNQILNPDAGKNLKPVEGLSGKAAENSVEKYEGSFKEKSTQETVNILKLQ
jgi:hypothetical protein